MKFKKYPESKPTKSGDYLVQIPVLYGDGTMSYIYHVFSWSNKWQAFNSSDIFNEDENLKHAVYDFDGWCEIVDEGYEE